MDDDWRSSSGSGSRRHGFARIADDDTVPDAVQEEVARRVAELKKEHLKERLKRKEMRAAAKLKAAARLKKISPAIPEPKHPVTPPVLNPHCRPKNELSFDRERLRLLIRQENMRLRSWLVDHCETITSRQRYVQVHVLLNGLKIEVKC